jgi:hypothetical protein
MTWDQAVEYCKSYGEGWRLPTLDELNIIRSTAHNFSEVWYWTSTTSEPRNDKCEYAYGFNMVDGKYSEFLKNAVCIRVRPVYDSK